MEIYDGIAKFDNIPLQESALPTIKIVPPTVKDIMDFEKLPKKRKSENLSKVKIFKQ